MERGAIEGAVNYPLSSLRQKVGELYVYCQVRVAGQAWVGNKGLELSVNSLVTEWGRVLHWLQGG